MQSDTRTAEMHIKSLVDEQLCCARLLHQSTPNDIIAEYTGHYPEKANWLDAAGVLMDFYRHNLQSSTMMEVRP